MNTMQPMLVNNSMSHNVHDMQYMQFRKEIFSFYFSCAKYFLIKQAAKSFSHSCLKYCQAQTPKMILQILHNTKVQNKNSARKRKTEKTFNVYAFRVLFLLIDLKQTHVFFLCVKHGRSGALIPTLLMKGDSVSMTHNRLLRIQFVKCPHSNCFHALFNFNIHQHHLNFSYKWRGPQNTHKLHSRPCNHLKCLSLISHIILMWKKVAGK